MEQEVLLTKAGIEGLQDELRRLKEVERAVVVQELQDARAQGDLSENAEYDNARNKQGKVESRIQEIEAMLSNAKLIDEKAGGVRIVRLGATVTIYNERLKEKQKYTIVGSVEADPKNRKISNESALAKAILNKGIGEKALVKANIPYEVQIVNIER